MDVWRVNLSLQEDSEACFAILAADEQARAERFHFAEHRRRFVVAHAALRCILANRIGVPPADLTFGQNPYGKPFLTNSGGPAFSLSHSHEMALCAVACEGEVGIDIEWCRELPYADLAQRFFAPTEWNTLKELAEDERAAGFFACWTRKEAYMKAKGLGLSLPLDSFVVAAHPRQAPALLVSKHESTDVGRYRFWEVPVPAGYRATLAYCGTQTGPPCSRDWQSPF